MPDVVIPNTVLFAQSVNIKRLLGSDRELRIPEFQRAYSWKASDEEDPVCKLWADVLRLYEQSFPQDARSDEPEAHFVGSIVLLSDDEDLDLPPEIIDGQQRLATLQILLSVLSEFVEDGPALAVISNLLAEPGAAQGYSPRLILNEEDEFFRRSFVDARTEGDRLEYWETQADDLSVRPAAHRMKDAAVWLHGQISEFVGHADDEAMRARNLVILVSELLIVMRLELRRPRMAYRVFETLNERGLELSQADLIKNDLLHAASQQGTGDAVLDSWDAMRSALDPLDDTLKITEFIHFDFVSRYTFVKHSDLFDSVQDLLESDSAVDYATRLKSSAKRLASFVDSTDASLSSAANGALEDLKDPLKVKYGYPLLMAGRERFNADSEGFSSLVVFVRNYCFRRLTVERTSLSKFEKEITEAARDLRNEDISPGAVLASLRANSTDHGFREAFASFSVGTNKLGFHILKRIEDHIGGGAGVTVNPQSPSQHLEHIAPKKPGEHWGDLPGDVRYESFITRLGNLLVLEGDINRHIKNKSFEHKRANDQDLDYAHSQMSLPGELDPFLVDGKWTLESIAERQTKLAEDYACAVWPLQ